MLKKLFAYSQKNKKAVCSLVLTSAYEGATMPPYYGPIAQLGERFNGIEEVKGSSPFRSTVPIDVIDNVGC